MNRFTPARPKYMWVGTDTFRPEGMILYRSDIPVGPSYYKIPDTFHFDGPSYPWWIRWRLNRLDERAMDASVVHDYLLFNRRILGLTRKQCDKVAREALQDRGFPKLECTYFYAGIRVWSILQGED